MNCDKCHKPIERNKYVILEDYCLCSDCMKEVKVSFVSKLKGMSRFEKALLREANPDSLIRQAEELG